MMLREAMARGDPEFPGGEAERRGWYAGYDAALAEAERATTADNAERDRRMYAQGRRDALEDLDTNPDDPEMADIGRAFLARMPEGYVYSDCPSEIITDLRDKTEDMGRIVRAAQNYFAEHQEDGEGVPQPQLREMLDALEAYEEYEQ